MLTITGKYTAAVMLTCPKCGKTYTRRKECYNRNHAARWVSWMAGNYKGTCLECWKASKGLTAHDTIKE